MARGPRSSLFGKRKMREIFEAINKHIPGWIQETSNSVSQLLSCVYPCFLICIVLLCVCIAVLHTVVAGLLARSQYPEGPATGHLGTGFSWFPCV